MLMGLDEIPDLNVREKNWRERSNNFIKEMGYSMVEVKITEDLIMYLPPEGILGIATGLSPRQTKFEKDRKMWNCIMHCVIGKFTQNIKEVDEDRVSLQTQCEFVFDPHPSDEYIKTLEWMTLLIPTPKPCICAL
jgi:hypothetical protein